MTGQRDGQRPRPTWLTVALYLVLVAVIGADVWAAVFWTEVGGSLGLPLAAAAAVVIVVLGALLLTDARRQARRRRAASAEAVVRQDGHRPSSGDHGRPRSAASDARGLRGPLSGR